MRILWVVAVAILAPSCALYPPGFRPADDFCSTPVAEKPMQRSTPSAEDVVGVWQVLDLVKGEVIEAWFEDRAGNVTVGISDGADHWGVSLVRSGDGFTLVDRDWRAAQILCIG